MRPQRTGRLVVLALLVIALATPAASSHVRAGNLWTSEQARTVRVVRGTKLYRVRCRGRGAGEVRYRHFACSGQTALDEKSIYTALVTYVLHPLGKYVGRRSGYIATNVKFAAFAVP
jgi:hypothetical protein